MSGTDEPGPLTSYEQSIICSVLVNVEPHPMTRAMKRLASDAGIPLEEIIKTVSEVLEKIQVHANFKRGKLS